MSAVSGYAVTHQPGSVRLTATTTTGEHVVLEFDHHDARMVGEVLREQGRRAYDGTCGIAAMRADRDALTNAIEALTR